ncbi:MAG TPA: zf-HC2 domain-containing protein [Mycobacteriales bacterium]|nr:zf-HC2 domain-containing protein [Mycobacteriales bacterium]
MRCDLVRAALSARMDGELAELPTEALDRHLAQCSDCRRWERQAVAVSRQARVSAAPNLDDLVARVVAAAHDIDAHSEREWRGVRLGICVVAALQFAVAIPVLVLGHDREAPLHVSHEMGSWDATIAIALVLAALRPVRAVGMSALVGVGALLLCTTAVLDLAAGRTSVMDEAPHLLTVAGWLLLHRLAVLESTRRPDDPARDLADVGHGVAESDSREIRGLSA